ncbi:MAG: hypothetical protein QNK89_01755 [Lacinutrix sp.]|uniref:hypothetical protein n=1 Tax=Lacinutrix sp. TaxID=1937692 RepID=UPI0030AEC27B
MRKAEIVFVFIAILGLIIKLIHWPYGSEILSLGILFLSMLYFYFGFAILNKVGLRALSKKKSYQNISKLRIFGSIATGFTFSIISIHILFKLQFWPYGHVNLGIGLVLLALLLITILIFYLKGRRQFIRINFLRFIIIGGFGLLLYSLSTDQLVDLYYGSDSEFAKEYKIYLQDESPEAARPTRDFNSN